MAGLVKLPFMNVQCNWDEVLRSTHHGRKVWVSCRRLGEKTEDSSLIKSADGQLHGEGKNGSFVVTNHTAWSFTVTHAKAGLTTTFLRPRRTLELHNKQLLCVDVSQSGGLGVCSAEDGKLWIWETDTGETRRNLEGHVGDVYTCRFFPSGVVVLSGGADLCLKIWSAQDGSCARTLMGHTRRITDSAIIDRGRNVISVSADGTAKLWDCGSAQCLDTVVSTQSAINSCALASDSSLLEGRCAPSEETECSTNDKLLLIACEDGSLRCCDICSRKNVMTYSGIKSPLSACTFLSSSLVLAGADDGTMATVDLRNPSSALNSFQFCESPVRALLQVSEERCLAGFRNGDCIVWKNDTITSKQDLLELTNLTGPDSDPITSVTKSSGHVYTSCRDGSVRSYSIA